MTKQLITAETSSKTEVPEFNTLMGLGTPAYCDAPRREARQRGGSFNKSVAQKTRNFFHLYCAAYLDQISFQMNPKVPKSLQNAPQGPPNPPEMLPKSTSDVTRSPLGDYVGPLMEKNLIFIAKKIAQRCPRAPRRPQNGVKFEVNFDFFLLFFLMLFFNEF